MPSSLLPMDSLGAIEGAGGQVRFGLWLPWVSSADGNRLNVKVIHERDQFRQDVAPRSFPLTHSARAPYGDFWSATVQVAGVPPPGSAWGTPGRYVYRYEIENPNAGRLDWIVDPYAREFGIGKMSAFTLGYQPYAWSAAEQTWRTPSLRDLVVYEIQITEFAGGLERARDRMAYLADLGVNAIEIMPLSNVAGLFDWGYLPIGYFGVDERFGNRADLQQLVDIAHQHRIAVIIDVVYGHAGVDFGYYDAYNRLRFDQNPFMGPFAQDLFSDFGKSTDFNRPLTRDYFYSVSHHWLEVYHVDGFRYDCVPNYWDGPFNGYASLVYDTYRLTRDRVAAGLPYWTRFSAPGDSQLRLLQVAEQLQNPLQVLYESYSNSTWQNDTYALARSAAAGNRGQLGPLGHALGLRRDDGDYPRQVSVNGDTIDKAPLQYIENHDHERFICNFGLIDQDVQSHNPLFLEGDRSRWFKLQPYLIALLLADGIPMLWQGQEVAENYFLPDIGSGRVALPRAVRWDYFYDDAGRNTISLVRRLLEIRKSREHLRRGDYFFFDDWQRYQSKGVLLYARLRGAKYTLVAVNTSDAEETVPFWFPIGGDYVEELHGGVLDLHGIIPLQQTSITIPSNYGRVWTAR